VPPYLGMVLGEAWHGVWRSGRFGTVGACQRRARAAAIVREVGFQRILEKKVQNSISHGIGSLLGKQNWKEENFFFLLRTTSFF
jgi:hypothetical protein